MLRVPPYVLGVQGAPKPTRRGPQRGDPYEGAPIWPSVLRPPIPLDPALGITLVLLTQCVALHGAFGTTRHPWSNVVLLRGRHYRRGFSESNGPLVFGKEFFRKYGREVILAAQGSHTEARYRGTLNRFS
jgi:hypothetical protein